MRENRNCLGCQKPIPIWVRIDGKRRNLRNRFYCLTCKPFGSELSRSRKPKNPRPSKVCSACGKKGIPARRNLCGGCQTKIRRHRTKLAAIAYLGGKCKRCGFDKHWAALEFHHNCGEKEFNIGMVANKSWEVIKKELLKCELLCANCHRAEHSNRDDPAFIAAVKNYKGKLLTW